MSLSNVEARDRALAAMCRVEVETTGLVEYRSGRELLVIADEQQLELVQSLSSDLNLRVLILQGGGASDSAVVRARGRPVRVNGYLGAFDVRLGEGLAESERLTADMVLDLSVEPLLPTSVKPPGYLHCEAGGAALQAALDSMSGLVGTFDKPQYFSYDPALCAHGRNGMTACTRCIDSCPAGAITSLAERVDVDPHLCQGGGICASVCPSGAVRYAYPTPGGLGGRIRVLLRSYREAAGTDPVLLFHSDQESCSEALRVCSSLLPVALEELGSVGPEIWLAALAYGARRVLLQDQVDLPAQVRTALDGQLAMVGQILSGLGYPGSAVAWVRDGEPALEEAGCMPPIAASGQAAMEDKRTVFYMALNHLHAQAERPRPMVELPAGSPFGVAVVDAKRCTLCMACASVCPGNALQDGRGAPKLRFLEANCIQCGLCTRTCPEDAIWITPRLRFDEALRNRLSVLCEEEPFCCISCGKPFATRSVIDNMLKRLSGHWMFQDERSRERLRMCEDCRVVDVVQDSNAMGDGGFTRQ